MIGQPSLTILWRHIIGTHHDRFGELINHHSNKIPITIAEIEANVTKLIADKLIGSVIECEINGDTFHRDASSNEEDLNWGDWEEETKALHHGWNVEGKCVSKRNKNKPPPRHKETADRTPSKKMQREIKPR